jgi:hypothetical protein
MVGKATRCLAIAALATHLWVSMVVAPWHQLAHHRFSGGNAAALDDAKVAVKQCGCGHHHPVCDPRLPASNHQVPAAPHHDHDDCLICQVMAQAVAPTDLATLELSPERIEFSPPVCAVQPLLGALIDPVSRGPPAA